MTITLPVHPLKGILLPMIRAVRGQDGRRYVDAEHPQGGFFRLPVEWTDRAAPWIAPRLHGREVLLDVRSLLELACAVRTALDSSRGRPKKGPVVPEQANPPIHASDPEERPTGERSMAGTAGDHAAGSARRVGHARPQSSSRRTKGRRG